MDALVLGMSNQPRGEILDALVLGMSNRARKGILDTSGKSVKLGAKRRASKSGLKVCASKSGVAWQLLGAWQLARVTNQPQRGDSALPRGRRRAPGLEPCPKRPNSIAYI